MTSGQCTIGAVTKVRLCLPSSRVEPSPTTILRSSKSVPKKFFIIANAFADETIVVEGYICINFAMLPEWSGSMC
ncbi:unknown [Acidaminococcus sp. CAG:917]|nr:unknown [Acidaminococcus sp. CAG:917]